MEESRVGLRGLDLPFALRRFKSLRMVRAFTCAFGLASLMFSFAAQAEVSPATPLNIDPQKITVSGLSAGAFMAVQLEVAYSSLFSGAAVFAGGVYGCAENSVISAQIQCMALPQQLDTRHFVAMANDEERKGHIDPLKNLDSHKVYVYAGTADTTVMPRESQILVEFYKQFIPEKKILFKNDLRAQHGQPTLHYGSTCDIGGSPWILNCGYDGAGAALKHLYGNLSPATEADPSHFYSIDQAQFAGPDAILGRYAYVYVPSSCQDSSGPPCALHVALHGCHQTPDELGDIYRMHSGYNEWAEANRIVILYPVARKSDANPNGCFDWWGYTGANYLDKDGVQMKAIRDMTAWLARLPSEDSTLAGSPTQVDVPATSRHRRR